jgi:hypothetical protein
MRINFKSGSLFLSNLYDYSTTDAAVKAAAKNLGKIAIATKYKPICDFRGPSWAHTTSEETHCVSAQIFGSFSKKEIKRLFEHGHWYEEAKKKGFSYEIFNFHGASANVEIK